MGGWKVLEKKKYENLIDSDEIAWVFTGYYFNLYFLRFDIFHPDWNDYEAFDHPPLAKYIVGESLYLKGYTIDSPDPKRFWNSIPINKFPIYFELVKHQIPNPTIVIPFIRSVIFVFALSSLLLIYLFVRTSYGILPALISTSLILINPIFNKISAWILAEPILLLFFTLFLVLCAFYLKRQKDIYLVFASVVCSLAFLTKLNGILLAPILIIVFLMKNKFSIAQQDWKLATVAVIAFLLVTIFLNPVFLNSGVKAIGKMVEVRLSAFRIYQETYKDVALLSLGDRFLTATKMIFFRYSLFYNSVNIPVELIMFVLGMYYSLRKKDLLLFSVFGFLVIIPISFLPYNVFKYYYWIFPFTHIIAGLSFNLFGEIWNGRPQLLKVKLPAHNAGHSADLPVK
jgi:4-amino-4-deoxy-L-arabinose transferase-like glycosyltransferase